MKFPDSYRCLQKNQFTADNYELIPIRYDDRELIRIWRNEQIFHLRQQTLLTPEAQDNYFQNIVSKLFDADKPGQLLFSFLKNGELIGYGGLVHINWVDKNAEISFLMNTALQENHFEDLWVHFLSLIEKVAFPYLDFHKIFTYAFDLRPRLYPALEKAGFVQEAVLKQHCFFEGKYKDVLIHTKFNPAHTLHFRPADSTDLMTYFHWANDPVVRENSINLEAIQLRDHQQWFEKKLNDPSAHMHIFYAGNEPAGHVRLDRDKDEWIISYLVDKKFRGMKLGSPMIRQILEHHAGKKFRALVKENNIPSLRVFERLGFQSADDIMIGADRYKVFVI